MNAALYTQDLETSFAKVLHAEKLSGKRLLIAGATGLIGSFLADAIMLQNVRNGLGCHIYAMGRSAARLQARFKQHAGSPLFHIEEHDVNLPIPSRMPAVDYIIHSASATHPLAYASDPVGAITANVFGAYNLLQYMAGTCPHARFVLTSSVEIYGQHRGDTEDFDEKYCGYIDCNTMRAGYPESKRVGEAMCQAYIRQHGLDCVIARLCRVYGPTMLRHDSKALSQFLRKALAHEDIVLKSAGNQYFSYAYVGDAVSALLSIMLAGEKGAAYNIADKASDITLRDLAQLIAQKAQVRLRFEQPDEQEKAGYSTANRATLNAELLQALGWKAQYSIETGLDRTLAILAEDGGGEE